MFSRPVAIHAKLVPACRKHGAGIQSNDVPPKAALCFTGFLLSQEWRVVVFWP